MSTNVWEPQRDTRADLCVSLNVHQVRMAWEDGEQRQRQALKMAASRHGDTGAGRTSLTWWHVRGRAAEIGLASWLHGHAASIAYGADHFDIAPPWAVQVKSVAEKNAALTIGLDKRHCWTCPYILVWVPDIGYCEILGWATAAEVRHNGNAITWHEGGRSISLPRASLHAMPDQDGIPAGWRMGPQSICPEGR